MNPLMDRDFLKRLDENKNHTIYAKVIALTLEEEPVEEITGRVTQGSINIDGTSSVRRTCSLSLVAQDMNINDFYWGLNTKFKLLIGLENTIDARYPDIIWFKQGTYLISSFNTSQNPNSFSISIQGKDKMSMLNGDVGGVVTSLSWDFGTIDEYDEETGMMVNKKYKIHDIIRDAVHQFAGEPFHNIIINDVDECGLELLEYRGLDPIYFLVNRATTEVDNMVIDGDQKFYLAKLVNGQYVKDTTRSKVKISELTSYDNKIALDLGEATDRMEGVILSSDSGDEIYSVLKITTGMTCGYRITDLTFAGDLIGKVGEAITSCVLDKIITMLGDFEYFYDLDGRFVFQRKKTYSRITWNNIVNNQDETYVDPAAYSSAVTYHFENGNLITSYQNSPDLKNLRNDFAIWGERKNTSGKPMPIHMRYAVDKKPVYYKSFDNIIYLTEAEKQRIDEEYSMEESEFEESIIGTGQSRFHVTPLPPGFDEGWWEIDDWTRRYLYYADVDNEHSMEYYLNLSGDEVYDIVTETLANYHRPAAGTQKTFADYVYELDRNQLGVFGKTWQTEDWLAGLPKPSSGNTYYYTGSFSIPGIEPTVKAGKTYWAWLFDTSLDLDGNEYISSVVHGSAVTDSPEDYPTKTTGCSHRFVYALQGKHLTGSSKMYHSYIYMPELPPSVKEEQSFLDRIDSDVEGGTESNYKIVGDWREIIYQMAKDYLKHSYDEDFLPTIIMNNKNYYPTGYTGYEQYYTDMFSFWRDIYNPEVETIDEPTPYATYYYTKGLSTNENGDSIEVYVEHKAEDVVEDVKVEDAKTKYGDIYVYEKGIYRKATGTDYSTRAGGVVYFFDAKTYYYLKDGEYLKVQKKKFKDGEKYYGSSDFDLNTGWNQKVLENPELLNFWFDFLDTDGELSQYSVPAVGDRTKAVNDNGVKAIYFRDTPQVVFKKDEKEHYTSGYTYVTLSPYLEDLFTISSQGKSAIDQLNEFLYNYSYCTESITISAIPIYYLEPNTRIFVYDESSKINGEYIVSKISLPLGHSGNMTINATKAVSSIY